MFSVLLLVAGLQMQPQVTLTTYPVWLGPDRSNCYQVTESYAACLQWLSTGSLIRIRVQPLDWTLDNAPTFDRGSCSLSEDEYERLLTSLAGFREAGEPLRILTEIGVVTNFHFNQVQERTASFVVRGVNGGLLYDPSIWYFDVLFKRPVTGTLDSILTPSNVDSWAGQSVVIDGLTYFVSSDEIRKEQVGRATRLIAAGPRETLGSAGAEFPDSVFHPVH